MPEAPAWINWIAASPLSLLINNSAWLFAIIEALHLLGIVLFGGALLAVDFGVLGAGFMPVEVRPLERQARPWLWAGLGTIVTSGGLMFIAEAKKCYFNPAFRFKMIAFVLAALLLATLRRGAIGRLEAGIARTPASLRTISVLSIGLWFAVAAGGRAIGFY